MKIKSSLISFACITFAGLGLTACASLIGGDWDESALKRAVSFDTKCPSEQIQILEHQDEGMSGNGRFLVSACGKKLKYIRLGKSYFEESKSPLAK